MEFSMTQKKYKGRKGGWEGGDIKEVTSMQEAGSRAKKAGLQVKGKVM